MSTETNPKFTVFDQYQRYRLIQRLIGIFSSSGMILEVGAADSPLQQMLPGHRIVSLDRVSNNGLSLRADAIHLPFQDGSFEITVSTDVLEHVPAQHRFDFLGELQRVTSNALILGFPSDTPLVKRADKALFEFVQRTMGIDYPFLKEHLEFGLPDVGQVRKFLAAHTGEIFEFSNANLYGWLLLQMSHFQTASHPEFAESLEYLNEFFNTYYEETSHLPPTYRTFFCLSEAACTIESKRIITESSQTSGFYKR